MPQPRIPEPVLREAYEAVRQHGNVTEAAKALRLPRATMDSRYSRALAQLQLPDIKQGPKPRPIAYNPSEHPKCSLVAEDGAEDATVLIFSDAHWTTLAQPRSLAHEAMLAAIPAIAPTHIIAAGDMLDLGQPTRHDPLGWQTTHRVRDELDCARQHLNDIVALAPKARRWWVRGNHDDRFDRWLAANAGAFADVAGLALADHFEDWRMCWRLDFNDAVVWHANHGGIHGAWNDTLKAGVTTISGHNHVLDVRGVTDMRGRRWGIKTGMLADPNWPCFNYAGANPKLWNPGFIVLTWRDGMLRTPEMCEITKSGAVFRGQVLVSKPRYRIKAGRAAA
jgi:hypothetical protein